MFGEFSVEMAESFLYYGKYYSSQDESEAEGTEDKMETEGKMETDKSTDNEVESEEEPGNLQRAWWFLEVAKNAFIKLSES